jgi:hypothetical protein
MTRAVRRSWYWKLTRFEVKISLQQTEVWSAYGRSEVGSGRESTKGFLGIRKIAEGP